MFFPLSTSLAVVQDVATIHRKKKKTVYFMVDMTRSSTKIQCQTRVSMGYTIRCAHTWHPLENPPFIAESNINW